MNESLNRTSSVSARLKEIMSTRGLKQKDLIEITGVSSSNMSHYLSEKRFPSDKTIKKMAIALGVPEGWLLGYDIEAKESHTVEIEDNDVYRSVLALIGSDSREKFVASLSRLNNKEIESIADIVEFIVYLCKKYDFPLTMIGIIPRAVQILGQKFEKYANNKFDSQDFDAKNFLSDIVQAVFSDQEVTTTLNSVGENIMDMAFKETNSFKSIKFVQSRI